MHKHAKTEPPQALNAHAFIIQQTQNPLASKDKMACENIFQYLKHSKHRRLLRTTAKTELE